MCLCVCVRAYVRACVCRPYILVFALAEYNIKRALHAVCVKWSIGERHKVPRRTTITANASTILQVQFSCLCMIHL